MLLTPPDGARTLWEELCNLVHQDNAADVSGASKLVPSVLLSEELPPELVTQHTAVYPPVAAPSADCADEGPTSSGPGGPPGPSSSPSTSLLGRMTARLQAAVAPAVGAPLAFMWSRFLSGCQARAQALPLEWHPRQPWLAAADERGRVQVLDLGPALAPRPPRNGATAAGRPELLRSAPAAGPGAGAGADPAGAGGGCLRVALRHETLQPEVCCLSWCPTSPGLLAVGSRGGVCLWAVAGEARPPLAGRSSGPWLRHLRARVGSARITALSWSPDGRLLAAASPDQAGLQVWDVASGVPTPVSAGVAAFDAVHWSPCGNYVFAAGTGSRHFYLFDTQRWRWARWELPPGGGVAAAAWAPPCASRPPVLLAALAGGGAHAVALHLVDAPPGLTAQLLPVALPGLGQGSSGGSGGTGPGTGPPGPGAGAEGSPAGGIVDMAWDARGERLAVLLGQPHAQAGRCVALYGTTSDPVVTARLLGFARPPQRLGEAAAPAAAAAAAAATAAAPEATEGPGAAGGSGAAPAAAAAAGGDTPLLCQLPGGLTCARWAPAAEGASGAGGTAAGPSCVVSVRVGARGVYNLPCYF